MTGLMAAYRLAGEDATRYHQPMVLVATWNDHHKRTVEHVVEAGLQTLYRVQLAAGLATVIGKVEWDVAAQQVTGYVDLAAYEKALS